jgi:predicted nucleic acid-binding protein
VSVTLDTGALVALDKGDPRMVALLDRIQQRGGSLHVPACVVAQAWRSPRQVRLARVLTARGTDIAALDAATARAVGLVLGAAGGTDVVDASVILLARTTGTVVITSDPDDLRLLDPRVALRTI